MEDDDRQVTTVFTVQPSFHHRHSTNQVSWSLTIVGERRGKMWLHVRRRFMILGLSSTDVGMTVGLWKLSSLDGRRPPWYRPLGKWGSIPESANSEMDALLLGFRGGAYLCVFGSLITATNPQLLTALTKRGGLTSSVLELFNKSQTDANEPGTLRQL